MNTPGAGGGLLCCVSMIFVIGLMFLAFAIRVVPENKRIRVYRLGRDIGEMGPGIVFIIPIIDQAKIVDLNSPNDSGDTHH